PDDIFRIVITVGVGLAAISFVAQAFVLFAIYRTTRKMQARTTQFMGSVEPIVQRVGPTMDRVGPGIDKIGPTLDRVGEGVERMGPLVDKAGPQIERIGPMVDRVGVLADRVSAAVSTANRMIEENRPRVAQVSTEAAALVRTGREQVEHFGEILHDAGDLA